MKNKLDIYSKDFEENFSVSLTINCFYMAVKDRARKLFNEGSVQKIKLTEGGSCYYLSGCVLSSDKQTVYKCMLRLDLHGWIDDKFVCDCPYHTSYEGLCKHNFALGLTFLDILHNGGNYKPAEGQTSHFLSEYLKSFQKTNHIVMGLLPDGCISIFPNLDVGPRDTYYSIENTLTAKIGFNDGSKPYVIKNFQELLYNFENTIDYSYGKKLSFVHNYRVLDKTSENLCYLLNDIVYHHDGGMFSRASFDKKISLFLVSW